MTKDVKMINTFDGANLNRLSNSRVMTEIVTNGANNARLQAVSQPASGANTAPTEKK